MCVLNFYWILLKTFIRKLKEESPSNEPNVTKLFLLSINKEKIKI